MNTSLFFNYMKINVITCPTFSQISKIPCVFKWVGNYTLDLSQQAEK